MSRPSEAAEYGITLNTTRLALVAAMCPDQTEAAAIRDWAARIAGTSPAPPPLVGSVAFWASDALSHRRPAWAAVFHAHSTRTSVPECGNGENLLGKYMGEGVLSLYGTTCNNGSSGLPRGCGYEYADVFPLFDWELIPGTTVPKGVPFPGCQGACCWVKKVQSRPFVGSATDGSRVAVAAMDTAIGNLTARRSFFFFDDAVVVLVAGAVDSTGGPAQTALAQQWLVEPHVTVGFVNGTVSTLPDGNYSLPDAAWLHADSTGWLPLPEAVSPGTQALPTLSSGLRYGNWDMIGPTNKTASGRTIVASLQHGPLPQQQLNSSTSSSGAAWGWAALPNITAADMPHAAATGGLGVIIAANTPSVQAVANTTGGSASVVFWPPAGSCSNGTLPSGACGGGSVTFETLRLHGEPSTDSPLTVNASCPCLLTLAENPAAAGTLTVAVSNPDTPGGLTINVTINRVLTGSPPACVVVGAPGNRTSTTLLFTLPASPVVDMGAAVVQTCSVV